MTKSSRSRARDRKKEREGQRQKNQQFLIVGVVVSIVVVIGLLVVLANLPADAPLPDGVLAKYSNFRQDKTSEGYHRLGNPNAPVSVVEYASFSCPGCENFHSTVFDELLPRIASGEINFTYVPLQTGSVPNPEGAARTALCAGEQGKFWEMHDTLFDWHSRFANTAFSGNRLTSGVTALGLDTARFNQCFSSAAVTTTLQSALSEGVGTTPSIQVNGTTLESTTLSAINEAIAARGIDFSNLESGLIANAEDSTDESAATEEAVTEISTEATEASEEMATEEAPTEESTPEATEASG